MLVQNVDFVIKAGMLLESDSSKIWNLELDTRKWIVHYDFYDNVSIIMGPNGCGKTYALLKIQEQFKKTHKSNSYYCSILDHKWEAPYTANEKLSSGIQIAMKLKQAIDNLKKGELLLLDLPETGLHIELQDSLIDYILKTIPETAQVIITTHSPNIINFHLDLIADREICWVEDKTTKKEIKAIQEKHKKYKEVNFEKIEKEEAEKEEAEKTIEERKRKEEEFKETKKTKRRKIEKEKKIKRERKFKNRMKYE